MAFSPFEKRYPDDHQVGPAVRLRRRGRVRPQRSAAPVPPADLARMVEAFRHFRVTPATGVAMAAARFPDAPPSSTRTARRRSPSSTSARRIAGGLVSTRSGGDGGRTLAIMCRNHRGLVEASWPVRGSAAPAAGQLRACSRASSRRCCEREGPHCRRPDADLAERLGEVDERIGARAATATVSSCAPSPRPAPPAPPRGRDVVLLTSGTTGLPKGAPRRDLGARRRLRARPFTTCSTAVDAPREPCSSGRRAVPRLRPRRVRRSGWRSAAGAILRRRFDAEAALAAIERHRAGVAMFVPVMLERILALPEATPSPLRRHQRAHRDHRRRRRCSRRCRRLHRRLRRRALQPLRLHRGRPGPRSPPRDLREAPGTVGRPRTGPVVMLDAEGRERRPARSAASSSAALVLKGYSGGGSRESIDGMLNTGDLAHPDAAGRLFIDGRQDDMIVSGGENVFPGEVEDVLASHPGGRRRRARRPRRAVRPAPGRLVVREPGARRRPAG